MRYQFIRFVLVGSIAAAANIASRVFFSQFFSFEYAVALAFPVGLTVGFILSRSFVFSGSRGALGSQIVRFIVVNLFALVQVWVVSVGLANIMFPLIGLTWQAELIAHTIGTLSPVVTSYLGHKHYTFQKSVNL